MIRSILASATIILFAVLAHAQEPAAFSYSYKLYNIQNGQEISSGKFAASTIPSKVVVENNLFSPIKSFTVKIASAYGDAQDGGYWSYTLQASSDNKNEYYTPTSNSFEKNQEVMVFGDKKNVIGFIYFENEHDYFFKNPEGLLRVRTGLTYTNHVEIYADSLARPQSCVGGDSQKAAEDIYPFWAIGEYEVLVSNVQVNSDHSIQWKETTKKCIDSVEDENEHGSFRACTKYEIVNERSVVLPSCS